MGIVGSVGYVEVAGHELLFVFVGVKLFALGGKERGAGGRGTTVSFR